MRVGRHVLRLDRPGHVLRRLVLHVIVVFAGVTSQYVRVELQELEFVQQDVELGVGEAVLC